MNKVSFFLCLISFSVSAHTACQKWELRGWVRVKANDLHLVVAEKTMSQKSLPVYFEASPKLVPYKHRYVKVQVEIKDKDLRPDSQIQKVLSVKEDVPDPLNQNAESEMKCLR